MWDTHRRGRGALLLLLQTLHRPPKNSDRALIRIGDVGRHSLNVRRRCVTITPPPSDFALDLLVLGDVGSDLLTLRGVEPLPYP